MQTPLLADLFGRFSGVPSFVAPEAAARFEACLRGLAMFEGDNAAELLAGDQRAQDDFWNAEDRWSASLRPYVVKDGMLQIPVKGVLLHNFSYAFGSWATGYIYIQKAFERGMADMGVRGIAFMIDSPGGQVAGCFEAVERMVKAKAGKPVRAFAHEHAYSAAFAIASVADKRIVSRTGGVGSIGAVTMHMDYSKALEQAGVKVTFIAESEGKTDGNPYEPLADRAEKRIHARISETYDYFVATVAKNLGLEEGKVRDLKSFTYSAKEAVSNGLADEIGSLDDAVAAFVAELDPEHNGDDHMSKEQTPAVDQAALDTARAEGFDAGKKEGKAEGAREGAVAERARISAILASDEAKKRPVAAMTVAMDTDKSVEDATAFLAKLPEETKAKTTPFKAGMETGNPEIEAGDEDEKDQNDPHAAITAFNLPGFNSTAKQ